MVRLSSSESLALFAACDRGHLGAVQHFFRRHPQATVSRPLFRTLRAGHQGGPLYDGHPSRGHNGATCLHVCAWRGHTAVVSWLLAQGANTYIEDAYGRSPLDVAAVESRALIQNVRVAPTEQPSKSTRASPGEMAAVRRVTLMPEDALSSAGQECAVCYVALSEVPDQKVAIMPGCHHVFCVRCLDRWLAMHNTCPMCRGRLSDTTTRDA